MQTVGLEGSISSVRVAGWQGTGVWQNGKLQQTSCLLGEMFLDGLLLPLCVLAVCLLQAGQHDQ
eukprot:12936898-Prorocentrum_lima.AAC.1